MIRKQVPHEKNFIHEKNIKQLCTVDRAKIINTLAYFFEQSIEQEGREYSQTQSTIYLHSLLDNQIYVMIQHDIKHLRLSKAAFILPLIHYTISFKEIKIWQTSVRNYVVDNVIYCLFFNKVLKLFLQNAHSVQYLPSLVNSAYCDIAICFPSAMVPKYLSSLGRRYF